MDQKNQFENFFCLKLKFSVYIKFISVEKKYFNSRFLVLNLRQISLEWFSRFKSFFLRIKFIFFYCMTEISLNIPIYAILLRNFLQL